MEGLRGNRGRFVIWTVVVLVTLALILIPLSLGHRAGTFNSFLCEGECPSEFAIPPQDVLEMKPVQQPAIPRVDYPINKEALEAAVAGPLGDPALGPEVGFVAADARNGEVLVNRESRTHVPASTTKVLTAWSVLAALGPDHRFETEVRRSGNTVYLVGGGDPYLVSKRVKRSWNGTSLERLAAETAEKLGSETVNLKFDDSLFTGPETNPTWSSSLIPSVVEPITALNVRALPETTRAPSADAAETFAAALEKNGVTVESVAAKKAPKDSELVTVGKSAPLREVASFMLEISDNTGAEILLRHTAIAKGEDASFKGGVKAVRALLDGAGIPTSNLELSDGSGLSRSNQISPVLLVELLTSALGSDRFAPLVTGLPVAGLNGSLAERFDFTPNARGVVRAKTGTLTGVSSLAGWANLPDGRTIVFAVMADQINGYPKGPPQDAVDHVAAAIATCAC